MARVQAPNGKWDTRDHPHEIAGTDPTVNRICSGVPPDHADWRDLPTVEIPTGTACGSCPHGGGLLRGRQVRCVVGGAIVPWITGRVADWNGLQFALLVAAVYAGILSFQVYARRPVEESSNR